MPRKLMLILNPHAGKKESKLRLFDLVDLFSRQDCTVTVCPTLQKHDATRFVQEMGDNFDLILCCGGDGTLNEVVTGLMPLELRPEVGYIPAGTTNDMANSLNMPKHLLQAAAAILQGNVHDHDIGYFQSHQADMVFPPDFRPAHEVQGKPRRTKAAQGNASRQAMQSPDSAYFVYVAAFGAFTDVTYLTPQSAKNALGFLAYIFEGIRRLPEIRPYKMTVEHDGQCLKGDFIFGAVTNSTSMGGIKNPIPGNIQLDDGLFEVLLVRNPTTPKHFRKIVRDLSRKQYKNENVVFFQTSQVKFFPETDISWALDGEDGGFHKNVDIKNLPKSIRILAGRP